MLLTEGLPGQEAGPDGQTVSEVVETVRSQIQVSGYLNEINTFITIAHDLTNYY